MTHADRLRLVRSRGEPSRITMRIGYRDEALLLKSPRASPLGRSARWRTSERSEPHRLQPQGRPERSRPCDWTVNGIGISRLRVPSFAPFTPAPPGSRAFAGLSVSRYSPRIGHGSCRGSAAKQLHDIAADTGPLPLHLPARPDPGRHLRCAAVAMLWPMQAVRRLVPAPRRALTGYLLAIGLILVAPAALIRGMVIRPAGSAFMKLVNHQRPVRSMAIGAPALIPMGLGISRRADLRALVARAGRGLRRPTSPPTRCRRRPATEARHPRIRP